MAIVIPQPGNDLDSVAFGAPVANQLNQLVPGPWVNLALTNGWVNYPGYAPAGYRLIPGLGIVSLRGMVSNPSATNGTQLVGTLPVEARPVATLEVITYIYLNAIDFGQLVIQFNGGIALNKSGGIPANITCSMVFTYTKA